MVELTRGWNSRLGFSLQGDGHHTYISAIYADSVAAKDGRLQPGDQVLMVKDCTPFTVMTFKALFIEITVAKKETNGFVFLQCQNWKM
jgi:hypothetical protein